MLYSGVTMVLLEKRALEISELNRLVKQILSNEIGTVTVIGELSNTARAPSGHYYFSLKDPHSQVSCAMFKSARPNFKLEDGQMVLATAKVSLYEPRGQYQLIVEQLQLHGTGQLQKAYEILKQKLQKEGLFNDDSKKGIPKRPYTIGIITSPKAAALMDVEKVLSKRYPLAHRILYPAQVQGMESAASLRRALSNAIHDERADVILMVRGGGSIEDLWSFNDEKLARMIAKCPIPLVTGVGHQTDTTIVDFVADQSCPTPSAAAACVSPDQSELLDRVHQYKLTIHGHLQILWEHKSLYLDQWRHRLISPKQMILLQHKSLDHMRQRLYQIIYQYLHQVRQRLQSSQQRSQLLSPINKIPHLSHHILQRTNSLRHASQAYYFMQKHQLDSLVNKLNLLNPDHVLERGYAVVTRTQADLIQSTDQLQVGDDVCIRWHKSSAQAKIEKISE